MDKKKAFDVLYIDYEKAFDKVSHHKLLFKMAKFGIGGSLLKWISNFVRMRRQTVKVGNVYSNMEAVKSGVTSQGNSARPIVFYTFLVGYFCMLARLWGETNYVCGRL